MGQIKNIKLHIVTDIKYMMSDRRSRKVAFKKKRKKLKKRFLLTSKKCWLIEEKLIPLYHHLVDGYSDKLREERPIKTEESDFEITPQVKEEPQEDFLVSVENPANQIKNSNQFKDVLNVEDQNITLGGDSIPSSSTQQKNHRCTVCDKLFPSQSKLSRHMRGHSGEKPHTCSHCGKSFSQKGHLNRHLRTSFLL